MESSHKNVNSTEESNSNSNSNSSSSVSVQMNETSSESNDIINNNNNNNNNNSDSDALAKGLSSILATVIKDFDSKAQHTFKSQHQLTLAIDRLTRELDQLLEDAPLPFIMQHAAKITAVRKRVSSLNSVLNSIQRRLDNVDRILSVGMLHENTTTEVSGQH